MNDERTCFVLIISTLRVKKSRVWNDRCFLFSEKKNRLILIRLNVSRRRVLHGYLAVVTTQLSSVAGNS